MMLIEECREVGAYDFYQSEDRFGIGEVLTVLTSPTHYYSSSLPSPIFVLIVGNLLCEAQLYFSKKGTEAWFGFEIFEIAEQENGLFRFIPYPSVEPFELEVDDETDLLEIEEQMWQCLMDLSLQPSNWVNTQFNPTFEFPRMCSFRWD